MNISYGIVFYLLGHVHILDPVFDVLEILRGEGSCMHIFKKKRMKMEKKNRKRKVL